MARRQGTHQKSSGRRPCSGHVWLWSRTCSAMRCATAGGHALIAAADETCPLEHLNAVCTNVDVAAAPAVLVVVVDDCCCDADADALMFDEGRGFGVGGRDVRMTNLCTHAAQMSHPHGMKCGTCAPRSYAVLQMVQRRSIASIASQTERKQDSPRLSCYLIQLR